MDYMVEESTGLRAVRYRSIVVWIHSITAAWSSPGGVGFAFHRVYEQGTPERMELFTWHKTLGALILVLALVRLAVRLMNRRRPTRRIFRDGSGSWPSGTIAYSTSCWSPCR